jgi:hypothetical protein
VPPIPPPIEPPVPPPIEPPVPPINPPIPPDPGPLPIPPVRPIAPILPIPPPEELDCNKVLDNIAHEEEAIAKLICAEGLRVQEILNHATSASEINDSTIASRELLDRIAVLEKLMIEKMQLLLGICSCVKPPETPDIICCEKLSSN